ncbi:MAG: alpha-mannosidase [bacterium]
MKSKMGISRNPKDYTVHMIGNAHIDAAWLWRWQETYEVVKATFRSALDLMREAPDFVFTCSSAVYYKWMEDGEPELFEEIKRRVKEGRWNIVGGWWQEPDCNIPCGESLVRQGLYGQRYFQEKFGAVAKVGYNVDTFGHCGTLPQILLKSGLDSYVFFRPGPHEKELPSGLFWWESPDGSRVLTCRPPHHYGFWGRDEEMAERIRSAAEQAPAPLRDVLCFYGVGDHGGGPTRENIRAIEEAKGCPDLPSVKFSSPDAFFGIARSETGKYPVVRDDLQHHARGCYSVHSEVKALNRRSEELLMSAEKFSSIARSFGRPYPREPLAQAWKAVLFNQFHDILAGTSIPEVYEDARNSYGMALHTADEILHASLRTIAAKIDTRGEGVAIVVFNPSSWRRRSPVEVEIPGLGRGPLRISDDEGKVVAHQLVQTSSTTAGDRRRILFLADIPALGYRLYRCRPVPEGEAVPPNPLSITEISVESDAWFLGLDPVAGHLTRLQDKRNGVEVLKGAGGALVVLDDPSDTWSHGVDEFRAEVGRFGDAKTAVVEWGPVRSVLRVMSRFGDSTAWQDWILYADLERIDCRITVDWREKHRMLKLAFPLNLDAPVATYEVPYGHIVRPTNGEEEPGQRWVDLTGRARGKRDGGTTYGLSLLNDSKYGFDAKDSELRMTVLRSPVYAFHYPAKVEAGRSYNYIDQGIQRLTCSLLPHAGTWQDAKTVRAACELNSPLICFTEPIHGGELPKVNSFIEVEPESVIVNAVKLAEDSDDIIARCYETAGKRARAKVEMPHLRREWRGNFRPCEIKTLKFSERGASEVDMLEREM